MIKLFTDLLTNLSSGMRISSSRTIKPFNFRFSQDQALILIGLVFIIALATDYYSTDADRYFNIYGLLEWIALEFILIASIFLLSRLLNDARNVTRFMIMMLSAWIPVYLLDSLFTLAGSFAYSYYTVLLLAGFFLTVLWLLFVSFRVMRIIYSTPIWQCIFLSLLLVSLNVGASAWLPGSPIWYSYSPDDYSDYDQPAMNVEDTYYSQLRLMEETVNAIQYNRADETDLYFVGFGGYASQDVFRHEVVYTRDLFDERFGTQGRSAILVNSEQTVTDTALANINNLRYLLNGISDRIDPDEDILFLYLTSHGSKEHELSVSFSPLQLNDMPAGTLAELLDESGIKWRVVVISSCYSGGFIEPLKNDYTLVITAADKDRTSFGCANDREFTYFGEAYFRDQLQNQFSFTDAFYAAEESIQVREIAEEKEPSLPQIYVGEKIEAKLGEYLQSIKKTEDTVLSVQAD